MRSVICFLLACLMFGSVNHARAELRFANIFNDHMVLQQDKPIHVWGWAEPGRRITVTLGDESRSVLVPEGGFWCVRLDPAEPGLPLTTTVDDGEQSVQHRNVLVGDVWLCSGQSNMRYRLERQLPGEYLLPLKTDAFSRRTE